MFRAERRADLSYCSCPTTHPHATDAAVYSVLLGKESVLQTDTLDFGTELPKSIHREF